MTLMKEEEEKKKEKKNQFQNQFQIQQFFRKPYICFVINHILSTAQL